MAGRFVGRIKKDIYPRRILPGMSILIESEFNIASCLRAVFVDLRHASAMRQHIWYFDNTHNGDMHLM